MLSLLTLTIAYRACRWLPRLLTEAIATILGVVVVMSNRRVHQALLGDLGARGCSAWDRRPTRRERRLLRTSLKASLRSTEFTSLFPSIAVRAHRIANRIDRTGQM